MKILFGKKQIVFAFVLFLISIMSWGQATFSGGGSGTEEDPWVILTVEDWNHFAASVNANRSYDYADKFIKLGADISVNQMVGHWEGSGGVAVAKVFRGTFDGDWHTLNINIHGNSVYAGPFVVTDGATIKNLTVTGNISTGGQYAGSIVSCVENSTRGVTNIINCTSSVEILIDTDLAVNNPHHGGLVGWLNAGELDFENCIFEGSIVGRKIGVNYLNYANNCAGFVGFITTKPNEPDITSVKYKNCTQAHTLIAHNGSTTFGTFHLPVDFAPLAVTGQTSPWETAYYTHRINNSDSQGTQAYFEDENPIPDIYKNKILKYYIREHAEVSKQFYVPFAIISGLNAGEIYTDPEPTVSYYGRELVYGTDYETEIKDNKLIVKAKTSSGDSGYYGSERIDDVIIETIGSWNKLKLLLGGNAYVNKVRHITLDKDYDGYDGNNTNGGVLEVKGTVYLDLNNHTIDRGLYSKEKVSSGQAVGIAKLANVTIIGPGTITGGNNDGHGGGIRCGGTLILKNVNVSRNSSNDRGGGVYLDSNSTDCYIEGGVIDYNWSSSGGGGVYSEGSNFKMKNVHVEHNQAHSKGGALRLETTAEITDCYLNHNTLFEHDAADGGGVWTKGSDHVFTRCEILYNNAYRWGGGCYMINGSVTFIDCDIEYNTSLTNGGGIFVYEGTLTLDGTRVMNNTSNATGGVCINRYTTPTKPNSTLQIKGATNISMNNGDATRMNLFIDNENSKIKIIGDLTHDAFISLSRNKTGIVTDGLKTYAGGISNFRSDNYKMYWLRIADGEVSLQSSLYWDKPKEWGEFVVHDGSGHYIIKAPLIIRNGVIADDPIRIEYIEPGIIFIEDGGQLVYNGAPVPATVLKNIAAATNDEGDAVTDGWYSISTPIKDLILTGVEANTNLITALMAPYNFDLLRYNEEESLWESYNNPAHVNDFKTLDVGRGYLYRNSQSLTIEYTANIITDNVVIKMSYSPEQAHEGLEGWNLIGNPFTHNIYKGACDCAIVNGDLLDEGFYRLANSGKWGATLDDGTAIQPGEGILVKARDEGELTITNTTAQSPKRANKEYLKFTVANSNYDDETYAVFDEGYGLPKISHRNADIPMVYINKDAENYAIAMMNDDVKSFSLNFKAMKTGQYTLSCEKDGDFSYLHVIDKLAGRDIDMLLDEKYTFIGSPRDADSRFIVRLSYNGGADESGKFAYQNGDDIIVCGEGELQVYDVLGRFVTSKHINGVETINLDATGVYILRLIGEDIRTQKMVVR